MENYVVEDLLLTKEVFLGRPKCFMTSELREKYIKLTLEQYEFYNHIVPWFLEMDDEVQLQERLNEYTGGKIQLENMRDVFSCNNLLKEKVQENQARVEVDLSSTKVCELSLVEFQMKHQTALRWLWRLLVIFACIVIGGSIGVVCFQPKLVQEAFRSAISLDLNEMLVVNFVLCMVGGILAILGHELGHLIIANRSGMKWKSFNCSLRWGVQFVYYIKYYNFYAFPSTTKIKILLAGVIMNFIQGCMWFLVFVCTHNIAFMVLVTVNFLGVINNILPKGTSDGYHIFCILTGLEGIRWKMLKVISSMLKTPKKIGGLLKKKENIVLSIYFIGSYFLSLFSCYVLLRSIFDYLSLIGNNIYIDLAYIAICGFIISSVVFNIVKLTKNLKNI